LDSLQSSIQNILHDDRDLLKLKDWLTENDIEAVAMESTGVYWKPIFNILENDFQVILCEPSIPQEGSGEKERC